MDMHLRLLEERRPLGVLALEHAQRGQVAVGEHAAHLELLAYAADELKLMGVLFLFVERVGVVQHTVEGVVGHVTKRVLPKAGPYRCDWTRRRLGELLQPRKDVTCRIRRGARRAVECSKEGRGGWGGLGKGLRIGVAASLSNGSA